LELLTDRAEELSAELASKDLSRTIGAARKWAPAGASERSIATLASRLLEATLAEVQSMRGMPIKRATVEKLNGRGPKVPTGPLMSVAVAEFIKDGVSLRDWSDAMERAGTSSLGRLVGLVGVRPVRDVSKEDMRGLPKSITVDHGPELEGQVLDSWAYEAGVQLSFIRLGKPNENAYIEGFNGKFRDQCLNERGLVTMALERSAISKTVLAGVAFTNMYSQ